MKGQEEVRNWVGQIQLGVKESSQGGTENNCFLVLRTFIED